MARIILGILLAFYLVLSVSRSHADVIGTTDITPSTSLGQYASYSLDQLHDGIVSDAFPYNGYASGFGVTSGLITLSLDQTYDLNSFSLWNDINIQSQGVRSFSLNFLDSSGMSIGTTGDLFAVSQFDAQVYNFSQTFLGVKTVELNISDSDLQIEIRELSFNGTATSSVPEPATLLLFGAGLIGLTRVRRKLV